MNLKNKAAFHNGLQKATHSNSQIEYSTKQTKNQVRKFDKKINFTELNKVIQSNMSDLIYKLLPFGEARGDEWFALNPTRCDHRIGSFSINTKSWKFYDFATGEGGHGAIALYAYIKGMKYYDAAKELQQLLEGKNE